MSEFKVGEVGVLCNMGRYGRGDMNGATAVVRIPLSNSFRGTGGKTPPIEPYYGYGCEVFGYSTTSVNHPHWAIEPDQIRRISPDDVKETHTDEMSHV